MDPHHAAAGATSLDGARRHHEASAGSTCASCSPRTGRGKRLAAEGAGLCLDTQNRVTDETLSLLVALAEQSGLAGRIEAMFAGEPINVSEGTARCCMSPCGCPEGPRWS
jgi:hypothetical protein